MTQKGMDMVGFTTISPPDFDNLICAAVINEQTLIIKTVMIHWKPRALP